MSEPQLPPLFSSIAVAAPYSPWDKAVEAVEAKNAEAGNTYWRATETRLALAIVLEPDVSIQQAQQMLYVMMVGAGDALGAVIPPEIAIQYRWPNFLLANGARFGQVNFKAFGKIENDPEFLVLGLQMDLRDDISLQEPGLREGTNLWDEGCGELEISHLIEALCRHFQVQLNTWEEEGFSAIHTQWVGRYDENPALLLEDDLEANFIGLDEMGNGLLKIRSEMTLQNLAALDLGLLKND